MKLWSRRARSWDRRWDDVLLAIGLTPTESELDALFSSSLVALRLSRLSISQKGCCRSGALAALLSQREGALDPEQRFP